MRVKKGFCEGKERGSVRVKKGFCEVRQCCVGAGGCK